MSYSQANQIRIKTSMPSEVSDGFDFRLIQQNHIYDGVEGYYPVQPIEFSIDLAAKLISFLDSCLVEGNQFRSNLIPFEEPVRSNLRHFMIALDAYYESPNPLLSKRFMIDLLMKGHEAFSILKLIRLKSFLISSGSEIYLETEIYKNSPFYYLNDIGDIFNYNYFFWWSEPDEKDYLITQEPVNINLEALEYFKRILYDILPERDEFERVDDLEILLNQTSSTSVSTDLKNKFPNWYGKSFIHKFSTDDMKGIRSLIPVSPGNYRDTVILPIETINSIQWIDKQTTLIIKDLKFNAVIKNQEEFLKKLSRFEKKHHWFICRDIKKEGLSKPREILKAIQSVFKEKYPDLPWERMDIYNNFSLIVNEQEVKTNRGHGLGMANSLTTLMQIIVHYMTLNQMVKEGYDINGIYSLNFNDDNVTGFVDILNMDAYWNAEDEIFRDLSLIRRPEKSFSGKSFVLCENYSSKFNTKESYLRCLILKALCSRNILEAKGLIRSLYHSIDEEYIDLYINEITSFWGYEFDYIETTLPSIFGGWKSARINNISYELYNLTYHKKLLALYEANKCNSLHLRNKKYKNLKLTPILTSLYGIDISSDEFAERFGFFKDNNPSNFFSRSLSDNKSINQAFIGLLKRRKKIFKEFNKEFLMEDLYKRISEENPMTDFIIPKEKHFCQYKELLEKCLYNQLWGFKCQNPKAAYLAYFYPKIFELNYGIANPLPFMTMNVNDLTIRFGNIDYFEKNLFITVQNNYIMNSYFHDTYYEIDSNSKNQLLNPYLCCYYSNRLGIREFSFLPSNEKKDKLIKIRKEFELSELVIDSLGIQHCKLIDYVHSYLIKKFQFDLTELYEYEEIIDYYINGSDDSSSDSESSKEFEEEELKKETLNERKLLDSIDLIKDPSLFWQLRQGSLRCEISDSVNRLLNHWIKFELNSLSMFKSNYYESDGIENILDVMIFRKMGILVKKINEKYYIYIEEPDLGDNNLFGEEDAAEDGDY